MGQGGPRKPNLVGGNDGSNSSIKCSNERNGKLIR